MRFTATQLLVGLAAVAAAALQETPRTDATPAGAAPVVVREDFEATAVDTLPKGWTAAFSIEPDSALPASRTTVAPTGAVATWSVVADPSAPSGKQILKLSETKNRGLVYNLCLRDGAAPADVRVEVKLRPDGGREDRGGGLVWRVQDANNYYLCRWNPLEKNLRVYRTAEGRRIQLHSVTVDAPTGTWHALEVTMVGRVMEVAFDSKKVLSYPDDTFKKGGQVGLWTKADALSSFDDFQVGPAGQ